MEQSLLVCTCAIHLSFKSLFNEKRYKSRVVDMRMCQKDHIYFFRIKNKARLSTGVFLASAPCLIPQSINIFLSLVSTKVQEPVTVLAAPVKDYLHRIFLSSLPYNIVIFIVPNINIKSKSKLLYAPFNHLYEFVYFTIILLRQAAAVLNTSRCFQHAHAAFLLFAYFFLFILLFP